MSESEKDTSKDSIENKDESKDSKSEKKVDDKNESSDLKALKAKRDEMKKNPVSSDNRYMIWVIVTVLLFWTVIMLIVGIIMILQTYPKSVPGKKYRIELKNLEKQIKNKEAKEKNSKEKSK